MGLLHREKHHGDVMVAEEDDRVHDQDETVVRPVPTTRERVDRGGVAKVKERDWTFAPGQVMSLAAGIAFVVVGLIAVIRAGLDGSLDEPVVAVLGWDHTAWLGLGEIGFGLLLVLAGAGPRGRPLSVMLGVLAVVAGVIILAEWDALPSEFAIEREFGWPLAIAGGVIALAAMLLPVWHSHVENREELDLRDRDTVTTRTAS